MTVKDALQFIKNELTKENIDSPAYTAGVLLCNILKCERSGLITQDEKMISKCDEEFIFSSVERLLKNEPIDYIVGKRGFMGLEFNVGEGVLIPRPDTELLVEKCIDFAQTMPKIKMVDFCTGTGCIPISVAFYLKNSCVEFDISGIDISPAAISFAMKNADENSVDVKFYQGDIFDLTTFEIPVKEFDIISANPPYIKSEVIKTLDKNVREYEPLIALDGGSSGLEFYERIVLFAPQYLRKGGMLALEIGFDQAGEVCDIIRENENFKDIRIFKDTAKLERVITCRLI